MKSAPLLKLVELVAAQNVLLERVVLALERAPTSPRAYSSKPSAIRMRKLRGDGEFKASRPPAPRDAPLSENGRHVPSPDVTPRLAVVAVPGSSAFAKIEKKRKSYAPRARIDPVLFRALYCHFAEAFRSATHRSWHGVGAVPPEEKRHAGELLHATGSLDGAKAAIARFGRLWREDAWTRSNLSFSLRYVVWSLEHIAEKRHRLHVVGARSSSPPRRRPPPLAAPEPAPPLVCRVSPPGLARAGDVLAQLRAKGLLPAIGRR